MTRLIALAFAVLTLAACGGQAASTAAGHSAGATARASQASAQASAGPSRSAAASGNAVLPVNLCSLLHWSDLGYPGIQKGTPSPTESGRAAGWDQSCFWASQQFNAGYVPPRDAQCDNNPGNSSVALHCVGVDAKKFASIEANSQWVRLTVAWRGTLTRVSPSEVSYTQNGNPVYLSDDTASSTCSAGLNWANGTLVVMNQDATKAFGSPCDEVKKVVALLIRREPH